MRKSTLATTRETSPIGNDLSSRLLRRMAEVVALVEAFHAEPITPTSAYAFEKKWLRFFARPAVR
jgi:hypothetical protein